MNIAIAWIMFLICILSSNACAEQKVLTFRLVLPEHEGISCEPQSVVIIGACQYECLWRENVGYLVSTKAELDNGDIEGAKLFEVSAGEWKEVEISSQAHDGGESGDPSGREFGIRIALNKSGEKKLEDLTGANVERRLAVVLDGKLIQAPIIKQKIYGGKISLGHLSYSRAKNLKDAVSPGGN